ncbi:glycerophosphodiester phosphodiesterase family protein [Modicisalibacter coralii]|uniref:glycerophosphodiester phosphodiesterase family protein n=1 Tax=Modicisalibacter coralii TaxID=2304602 RepID=UPI00100A3454|nr:glycerophosphodiester phosphodiesterase family protein [Halomonas coralii]
MLETTSGALAPRALGLAVGRSLREHWRPLVAYQLFFTLLATTLLLPIGATLLAALLKRLGRPLLTGTQLLDTILTPLGLLWMLVAIGLASLLLVLQQAGMLLVVTRPAANRYRLALEALWGVGRRLPGLTLLTLVQTGAQVAIALPMILALTGLYQLCLGDMESYVISQTHPPALWGFLAASIAPLLLWLWAAASLHLRWSQALAVLMLEDRSALNALRRSRTLTRGRHRPLLLPVALPAVLIIALPVAASALFDALFTPLLWWLPERVAVLMPAMLGYLTLYGLLALTATFIGAAINSLLGGCVYLRLAHRRPRPPTPTSHDHPAWVAWGAEALVLAFAAWQAWSVLNSFEIHDTVTVTAHRGSAAQAPENTLAAFDRAIADGADYIEFDVRLSADDRVVVSHDDSLRRLIGSSQRISEMAWADIQRIDVGSWFGDAYRGQRIPSLSQVLDATRGRVKLYIELKPVGGNAEALVDAVLERLPRERYDEIVIASLSSRAIAAVERRAPTLRTTLFAQFLVRGGLYLGPIDALGLRYNRITEHSVEAAHRRGYALHAWTVNDRRQMARLIDLGVDNIITDRPALLREVLRERDDLSDGELLLLKLRSWLHS